jgi:hypothetical protein
MIDQIDGKNVPNFTWICCSFKDYHFHGETVEPEAGFSSEGDVAEFIRAVEMSEGYTPVVFEWDSEKDLYYKTDKFNEL